MVYAGEHCHGFLTVAQRKRNCTQYSCGWEKYAELQSHLVALLFFGCFATPLTGCCNSLLSYHILAADTFKTQADWSAMMDDFILEEVHVILWLPNKMITA